MKLGKEFIGRLPPGAQEQLNDAIASFRENAALGVEIRGVRVSPAPDGCKAALAQEGRVYQLNAPPSLPFEGCDRSPCCGCCYQPVID